MPITMPKVRRSALAAVAIAAFSQTVGASDIAVVPAKLPLVGRVDERFQSYNVEMTEVTGGRFWSPYPKVAGAAALGSSVTEMFRQRDPLDLGTRRLRVLAKALGPSYVRVSGAWANSTYFQDDEAPRLAKAPTGYQSVLTRKQWAGVIDFARSVDAKVVASFGISAGARAPDGVWNPENARRLLTYTRSIGGRIDAAELMNEPNVGPLVGAPKGYDAMLFARDQAVFRDLVARSAPEVKTVGPGSTGEAGFQLFPKIPSTLTTDALMTATPQPRFDIFSYHFYGTVSQRCKAMGPATGTSPDDALSEAWLSRADTTFDHYKAVRDRFVPGAPIWVTELAQTACGGDRWAASFLDSFRYVDQMARLARRGTSVLFHNTLAASDYALIDEDTLDPRPSYWTALLWRRLMGPIVLDAGPMSGNVHIYAHCLRDRPGGVALLAINLDRSAPQSLAVPGSSLVYTLTADDIAGNVVKLNGNRLMVGRGDRLPRLEARSASGATIALPAASISFVAIPRAGNAVCR
jgi:heparanase 1